MLLMQKYEKERHSKYVTKDSDTLFTLYFILYT